MDIILLESGGDNLAANFSPELADYTIYVIDVSGGDKVPRKGGPGVTQSDCLVINKTDVSNHRILLKKGKKTLNCTALPNYCLSSNLLWGN